GADRQAEGGRPRRRPGRLAEDARSARRGAVDRRGPRPELPRAARLDDRAGRAAPGRAPLRAPDAGLQGVARSAPRRGAARRLGPGPRRALTTPSAAVAPARGGIVAAHGRPRP